MVGDTGGDEVVGVCAWEAVAEFVGAEEFFVRVDVLPAGGVDK